MAVDPAATDNPWSDDTGVVIGAVDEINNLWIVEAAAIKRNPNLVADFIINKYVQYRPYRLGIELGLQNSLQYLLQMKAQMYEQFHNMKLGMTIVPIQVSRKRSKSQRISLTFGAFVREGRCHIHENCTQLLEQMRYFTGREMDKDDLVDAASMLFQTIETFSQFYWFKPQGLAPASFGYTFQDLFKPHESSWEERFVG
jgi:hypothetical protein